MNKIHLTSLALSIFSTTLITVLGTGGIGVSTLTNEKVPTLSTHQNNKVDNTKQIIVLQNHIPKELQVMASLDGNYGNPTIIKQGDSVTFQFTGIDNSPEEMTVIVQKIDRVTPIIYTTEKGDDIQFKVSRESSGQDSVRFGLGLSDKRYLLTKEIRTGYDADNISNIIVDFTSFEEEQ